MYTPWLIVETMEKGHSISQCLRVLNTEVCCGAVVASHSTTHVEVVLLCMCMCMYSTICDCVVY